MRMNEIHKLLCRIVELLETLSPTRRQEYFTTAEVAKILGKRIYTTREWCRLGRVHAVKTMAGRGEDAEWRISAAEVERIKNEGLLPPKDRF